MSFFTYLLYIGVTITVFEFLWKIIFLVFAFASVLWKGFFYIGRALGFYLLVSIFGLLTGYYMNDASIAGAWLAFFTGLFVTFITIGGGIMQAKRNMLQEGNYYGLQLLRYDDFYFFGSLLLYIVVLLAPSLAQNILVFSLIDAISWIWNLPIIGWIVSLYGFYSVLGIGFYALLMGGFAVIGPIAVIYRKLGIAEKRSKENAYELFDVPFPKWKDKFTISEKKLFMHIYNCLNTEKILPQDSYDPILHFPGVGNLFFKTKVFRRGKIYLNINNHKGIVVTMDSTKKQIKEFLQKYDISMPLKAQA